MKIREAIALFTGYIVNERRLSAGTVTYYVGCTEAFARYMETQQITELQDIAPRDIRLWQMEQMEQNIAPTTIRRNMAALRAWFKYLRRNDHLNWDIMVFVTPPKTPQRLPIFFREQEVEHIYDDIYPNNYSGEVEKLVLRILYETGIRRSELSGLTLGNVDTTKFTLKVLGKRNKERYIPIQHELATAINSYLPHRTAILQEQAEHHPERINSDRLLINKHGLPLNTSMIYRIVSHYMLQLSDADRTSPHIFRHTFATHMLDEGANIEAVKELLGHSSLVSTEIYTHVSRERLKETYKHAHPRALKQ